MEQTTVDKDSETVPETSCCSVVAIVLQVNT